MALATSSVSTLQLTINCGDTQSEAKCPPDPDKRSPVALEAIANTTPLVLNQDFFPLGTEPKLFDAFYLGCPEAFSKPDALVRVCFTALDGTRLRWKSRMRIDAGRGARARAMRGWYQPSCRGVGVPRYSSSSRR